MIWATKITNLRHPETIHRRRGHLSPDALRRKQWLAFEEGTFVGRIHQALKISEIGSMCLLQQYETQQNSSIKVVFVYRSWLSCVHFTIFASHPRWDQDISSFEARLCPVTVRLHCLYKYE